MTAVLARTPAHIAARIADLVALFEADPQPIRDMEAREILAGNQRAMRAWDELTNACDVEEGLGQGFNPLRWCPQDAERMSPAIEDAEAYVRHTADRQHTEARHALLEAVTVAADVDQLQRAATAMRSADPLLWRWPAAWLAMQARKLQMAGCLADCPHWQDADQAIRVAAAFLRETRCEVAS